MSAEKKIRVGSRKSELALIQTKHVISLLKEKHPEIEFEIVTMNTLGDKVLDIPLPKIGEKSLFTKELEAALITGCVDFVVHSLKDLPTTLPPGMAIGAVLTREDPRDAMVLQKDLKPMTLSTLPEGSVIGTSSLRRTAQLSRKYPHLKVENVRGNLNTRLKKLDELGQFHAIILAAAGLNRMGWHSRISQVLDCDELMYAVGQGALAVECRSNDEETINLLAPLYDLHTALTVISERSFMRTLGGGCSAPVAVSSDLRNAKGIDYTLELHGAVWSLDGKEEVQEKGETTVQAGALKCEAECPLKNGSMTNIEDISCMKMCAKCPKKQAFEAVPAKRQKLDIPAEVLKNDMHAHCPVQMPIGADFMGKCPYLESGMAKEGKCPVNGTMEGHTVPDIQKCPFMAHKKDEQNDLVQSSSSAEDDGLYCGLVPHKDITADALLKALNLGKDLASKLVEKGALTIMSKAQAVIHSSVVGAANQ